MSIAKRVEKLERLERQAAPTGDSDELLSTCWIVFAFRAAEATETADVDAWREAAWANLQARRLPENYPRATFDYVFDAWLERGA